MGLMPEDEKSLRKLKKLVDFLREYHDHKVLGLEYVPEKGRALVVFNHSLATYDMALFADAVLEDKKRQIRGLGDKLIFRIPFLKGFATRVGIVEGTKQNAENLLANDEIVGVAPGGMKEALRSRDRRYEIDWQGRLGFVKLAMKMQAPIILVACPHSDDIFQVEPHLLTDLAYQLFKVPLPVFKRQRGNPLLPEPVQLIHLVREPILPPTIEFGTEPPELQVLLFQKHLQAEMEKLLLHARTLV